MIKLKPRLKSDLSITPVKEIQKILPHIPLSSEYTYLDPCVGESFAYPNALRFPHITTLDIRPECKADITADFLDWSPSCLYNVVIGAPPTEPDLCAPFIRKAFDCVPVGGYVIMLTTRYFFTSICNIELFKDFPIYQMFMHRAINFSHIWWIKGYQPQSEFIQLKAIL